MLDAILGGKIAARLMLMIHHYGDIYPRGAARDLGVAVQPVQHQLQKFEKAGILVSRLVGKTRLYSFNQKSPMTKAFMKMVDISYQSLTLEDKERLFATRLRPRRPGKPVIGRKKAK